MTNEEIVTSFMREHYTDERLCWLLEHARSGKLTFVSCCCFVGIATSDHAIKGYVSKYEDVKHYRDASHLSNAGVAQWAYANLCFDDDSQVKLSLDEKNAVRRAKLIPLIEAEIARRDALKVQQEIDIYDQETA